MSVTDTLLDLGVLPESGLGLARPERVHVAASLVKLDAVRGLLEGTPRAEVGSTFARLDVVVQEPTAPIPVGPSLSLSWSDVNVMRACLSGLIGKIVNVELVGDKRGEVHIMDLRESRGEAVLLCRERGGASLSSYAHPPTIPNKLMIPLREVIRLHLT